MGSILTWALPMFTFEIFSHAEEVVFRGFLITFMVLGGLRFIIRDGCDIYEELQKKTKRWRRRAP